MEPEFHPPSRWTRILWISLLAGLLILALASRPLYRGMRTWRAQRLAADVERLIQEENWNEAFSRAQAAYQLNPQDARVLRSVAYLYRAGRQAQGTVFWTQYLETGEATLEDRKAFVEFALDVNKPELADEEIERLVAEHPRDADVLRMAGHLRMLRGDHDGAAEMLRQAVAARPKDNQLKLQYAEALAVAPTWEELNEAREILWEVARSKEPSAVAALRLLARLPVRTREESAALIKALESDPEMGIERLLLRLDLNLAMQPERQEELLAEAFAEFRSRQPRERLGFARWLNLHRAYPLTLELLSLEEAMPDADLLLARLDAMAATDQWKEVRAALARKDLPLDPVLAELFRARAAHETGDDQSKMIHWRKVHTEAVKKPEMLFYVAQYAERIGEVAEATRTYRNLVNTPVLARQAYESLIRLGEDAGETRSLRDLMKEMAERFPDDPAPRNDLAYLNLLLKENIEAAYENASKLFHSDTNLLAYRTTLALAELRRNRPSAALALYDGLDLNWSALLPGWQAVHASVRAANGQSSFARVLARQVPMDRLKPEERTLVKEYVGELDGGRG